MQDKFALSQRENIFLAKKLLIQAIYDSARLEGCNITFPQTETILNGVSVAGLKMSDVETVLNLRDAWRFVLQSINEPLTLDYCNKVNGYVARNESLDWGVLRYGAVGISGTSYKPPIPNEENVKRSLDEILSANKSNTEIGIDLFLYGCRAQNYWDGNKRTSIIISNKVLIQNGAGVLSIPEDNLPKFGTLLSEFYETNNNSAIKQFLYDNTIKGLEIDRDLAKKRCINATEYRDDEDAYPMKGVKSDFGSRLATAKKESSAREEQSRLDSGPRNAIPEDVL